MESIQFFVVILERQAQCFHSNIFFFRQSNPPLSHLMIDNLNMQETR